jgi:hypothetical protein
MDKELQGQLAAMRKQVGEAALPDGFKQTAAWCWGQLPALYAKLRQTNESRYCDEIARLVQGLLQELAKSNSICSEAPVIAASIAGRLRLFHEQFGLPRLVLKSPKVKIR